MILLLPALLIVKACSGGSTPDTAPTLKSAQRTETATVSAKPSVKSTATPSETATAKPTKSSTPTPSIGDCANPDISVSITADAESYVFGTPITMAMRITNVGTLDCKRDVGALSNEIYVTDVDGAIVWSSDACQKEAKPQIATMHPGAVYGSTQVWSGQNSGRDCTQAAPDAAPGSYLAYGRNDTVVSKPFAFTIS